VSAVASAEGPKIDRSAILRYGDDLTRGGGVLFDPTMAVLRVRRPARSGT
jgi:hypothetical protein